MGELTRKQTFLLALGLKNGGYVRTETAVEVFGSESMAVSKLNYLRVMGYIRISDTPGIFYLMKAPQESFSWAENLRKEDKLRGQKTIIEMTHDKIVEDVDKRIEKIGDGNVDDE